jgi:hypothetical protein
VPKGNFGAAFRHLDVTGRLAALLEFGIVAHEGWSRMEVEAMIPGTDGTVSVLESVFEHRTASALGGVHAFRL